jgi:hypothetical protein
MGTAFGDSAGLFEPFELEDDAVTSGWLPVPSDELGRRFFTKIRAELDDLGLPTEAHDHAADRAEFVASSSGDLISVEDGGAPSDAGPPRGLGGRSGSHTDDLRSLWSDMTTQFRAHPGAKW